MPSTEGGIEAMSDKKQKQWENCQTKLKEYRQKKKEEGEKGLPAVTSEECRAMSDTIAKEVEEGKKVPLVQTDSSHGQAQEECESVPKESEKKHPPPVKPRKRRKKESAAPPSTPMNPPSPPSQPTSQTSIPPPPQIVHEHPSPPKPLHNSMEEEENDTKVLSEQNNAETDDEASDSHSAIEEANPHTTSTEEEGRKKEKHTSLFHSSRKSSFKNRPPRPTAPSPLTLPPHLYRRTTQSSRDHGRSVDGIRGPSSFPHRLRFV